MSAPKALRAGYAGKAPAERRQTIRTPDSILAPVRRAWGSIQLDPCASRYARNHIADVNYSARGLDLPWFDRSFCNPPFDDLVSWMRKAQRESLRGYRIALLGPWRSHRNGFCGTLAGLAARVADAEVIWLKAFAFRGQRHAAPFPCFLATWNCSLPHLGALEMGRAFVWQAKGVDDDRDHRRARTVLGPQQRTMGAVSTLGNPEREPWSTTARTRLDVRW